MRVLTIGRSSDNDVNINDAKVSRHHLQLIQDDNGNFRLADFGSTNGTCVNGTKIRGEVRLSPNDVVKIGNTVLPWQSYFGYAGGGNGGGHRPNPQQRQRHGFVTFWLVLIIIGGVISLTQGFVCYANAMYTTGLLVTAILGGLCAITSAVLMFNWMKIGFWLQVCGGGVVGAVNVFLLSQLGIDIGVLLTLQITGIILGTVVLWAILQLKKEGVSCWDNLE